jgi:uncharacterized coiled-coil DUF342 family protein
MSAPSKEEIADVVSFARGDVGLGIIDSIALRSRVIVALADENERLLVDLREEVETNVGLRAKLDGARDENERLRARVGALEEASAVFRRESDELSKRVRVLRAERAECLALLGDAREQVAMAASARRPMPGNVKWLSAVEDLLAKLRGQP